MNTLQFGLDRENHIIAVLHITPFLPSSLVKQAFFPGASLRMAQRVLTRMTKNEVVSRFRYGQEYVYHVVPKNRKWRHHVEVARFHYSLLDSLANWQEVLEYEFEKVVGSAIADIYYKMVYKPKDIREFYVEVDLGGNPIRFDKYPKHYTVVLVTKQKVKPPANWILTTIEGVKKHGVRLGKMGRTDDDRYFQDIPRESEKREEAKERTFFQQGKSTR